MGLNKNATQVQHSLGQNLHHQTLIHAERCVMLAKKLSVPVADRQ
jgi:hypothetical protein